MEKIINFWKKYSFFVLIIFLLLGIINFKFSLIAIICMIGPIILALLGKGRFWCGNICPRGNFFDRVLIRFSNNKKINKFLKSKIFRIIIITFMFYMFGSGIYKNWGDLYNIGMVFYRMIIITTLVGIILSFFYNHRAWCNFCPMGSIAAYISYLKVGKKTLKVSSQCINCKICENNCPMALAPYEYKKGSINHYDCIQCKKCVNVCPQNAIYY